MTAHAESQASEAEIISPLDVGGSVETHRKQMSRTCPLLGTDQGRRQEAKPSHVRARSCIHPELAMPSQVVREKMRLWGGIEIKFGRGGGFCPQRHQGWRYL